MASSIGEMKTCISSFSLSEEMLTQDLKFEIAIQKLKALCQARYAYNYSLSSFFLLSTPEEVKQYIIETLGGWFHQDTDSASLKAAAINGATGDCKFYKKILEKINTEPHTQSLVDHLHFDLSQYLVGLRHDHQKEQNKINQLYKKSHHKASKKLIAKQKTESYRELDFVPECISILEDVISKAQAAFSDEATMDVAETSEGSFFSLTISDNRLNDCKMMLKFLAANISLMETEITRIIDEEVPIMQEIEPEPKQTKIDWENFHKIYALQNRLKPTYKAVKNLLKQVDKHLTSETAPSLDQHHRVIPQVAPTVTLPSAAALEVKEDLESSERQAFLEEEQDEQMIAAIKQHKQDAKQKIAEYKFKIETEREARRTLKLAKRKAIAIPGLQEQPYSVMERKRKLTFSLLSNVNSNNLTLLQFIFSKPTPHLKISYSEVENLFGYDTGKLNGCISSVHGGSHRKIIISNVVGFFDSSSPSENNKTTGGTFKSHHPGHNHKLPSIAITMLVVTLERAGIDANSLNLFRAAKQRAAKQEVLRDPQCGPENTKDMLLQILKAADILENDKRRLIFLRKIYNDTSSVVHKLSEPGCCIERKNILKNIFKYL